MMLEKAEQLNFDLDKFAREFDPYEYADSIDGCYDWANSMEESLSLLLNGQTKPFLDWFDEVVFADGNEDGEAKELYERIKAFA